MKLSKNVHPKIGLWKLLPKIFSENTAQAIYPNIFLPAGIYENLISENPKAKLIGALIHEQTHIERQKNLGPIKWNFMYIFSGKFRLNEELEANKKQMAFLKKNNEKFNFSERAKWLSGWLYLWPDSYNHIKLKIEKIWDNL